MSSENLPPVKDERLSLCSLCLSFFSYPVSHLRSIRSVFQDQLRNIQVSLTFSRSIEIISARPGHRVIFLSRLSIYRGLYFSRSAALRRALPRRYRRGINRRGISTGRSRVLSSVILFFGRFNYPTGRAAYGMYKTICSSDERRGQALVAIQWRKTVQTRAQSQRSGTMLAYGRSDSFFGGG